jgi:glycosyltransferase involved in cell wall biosynthesis
MRTPDVVYALPDKVGGVFNFCGNLLAHRRPGGLPHGAVLTHNRQSIDARAAEPLAADWQVSVEDILPDENLYAALRRVRRTLDGTGALVANDWIELAAAAVYPVDRAVFSIVHGDFDFYYDLAVRHDPDIDIYVTYTEAIRRRLIELLPHRESDIVLRRYGVLVRGARVPAPGPLRLLYAGRIDRRKGVFDLPAIAAHLDAASVNVTWTVQGTGPDADALRREWPSPRVTWTGRRSMEEVLAGYERHDVLVMPSRSEGLPVALLEAGAAGVVPVVSDLPSGIPEVVTNGVTGWRLPVGDTRAFADAIARLAADRSTLEAIGARVRALVAQDWNIERQASEYEALFERWSDVRRPRHHGRKLPYGSRLDLPWMPNAMVRAVRTLRRKGVHA